jgi:hypothetical protein
MKRQTKWMWANFAAYYTWTDKTTLKFWVAKPSSYVGGYIVSAEYAASIFRSSEIWISAHVTVQGQDPEDHNISDNSRENLTTCNKW